MFELKKSLFLRGCSTEVVVADDGDVLADEDVEVEKSVGLK